MTDNEEYALRIANGESLSAILDGVRDSAYVEGHAKGVSDERATQPHGANSVRVESGGRDE